MVESDRPQLTIHCSRSALSVLVGALFKEFGLFLNMSRTYVTWRMRFPCWMTKATHTYTHTHSLTHSLRISNTYCFSATTMATRTRVNVKLCVYCMSCFFCCFVTQRSQTKLQDQSGQQKDIFVKYLNVPWTDMSDDNAVLFVLHIEVRTCPTLLLILLFVAKSDIIGDWRVI